MARQYKHSLPRINKRDTVRNPHTTYPVARETPLVTVNVPMASSTSAKILGYSHTLVECVCCGYKFPSADLSFYGRCSECNAAYKLDIAKHGLAAYHVEQS